MPTFKPFFSSNKNYGLIYLQAETKKLIDKGILLYNNSIYLGHQFHIKKPKALLKHIAKSTQKQKNLKNINSIKMLLQDFENIKSLFVYTEKQKIFSHTDLWSTWQNNFRSSEDKCCLSRLQKDWQAHAKFSAHTSKALYEASTVLAELEIHTHQAQQELRQFNFHLNKNLIQDYHSYLLELKNTINEEKKTISRSMCARLELADQSYDMNYDDVTYELETQLKKLDICLPTKAHINTPRQGMDADKILAFSSYIKTNGDEETQAKLSMMSWLSPDAALPLCLHTIDNKHYFIPAELARLVPNKTKKPNWLFQGHNQRCQFLQNDTNLLLQLSKLSSLLMRHEKNTDPLNTKPWVQIKKLQSTLENKLNNIAKNRPRGLLKHLQKTNLTFLQLCHDTLNTHLTSIINKKLDFITQFLPQDPPINHLMDECFFAPETLSGLLQILDDIELDMKFQIQPMIDHTEMEIIKLKIGMQSKPADTDIKSLKKLIKKQKSKIKELKQIHARFLYLKNRLNNLIDKDLKIIAQNEERAAFTKTLHLVAKQDPSLSKENYDQIIIFFKNLSEDKKKIFIDRHKAVLQQIRSGAEKFFSVDFPKIFKTNSKTLSNTTFSLQLLQQIDYANNHKFLSPTIRSLLTRYKQYIEHTSAEFLYKDREEIWQFNILLQTALSAECHEPFKLILEELCIKIDSVSINLMPASPPTDHLTTTSIAIQSKFNDLNQALDHLINNSPVTEQQIKKTSGPNFIPSNAQTTNSNACSLQYQDTEIACQSINITI